MRRRTAYLLASLLASGCGAADQAAARVIRGGAINPAVEAGGQPLPDRPPPAIPHSLIGAIAAEGSTDRWPLWPWRWFAGKRHWTHGPVAPAPAAAVR